MRRPRGQRLLIAQADRSPPLGPPPARLRADEVDAWHAIAAACPPVLRRYDEVMLELAARTLAFWRSGHGYRECLRLLLRMVGDFFMPMRARRRLLFPDRPKRSAQ
jgi:hypothetical protein